MATKALYAGSFDPVHRGHIDIAAAAARKYGGEPDAALSSRA